MPTKAEKPDPPVCKVASKSFPVQNTALSDETGWKKLNVWSSSFDLQNCTAFSPFHSQLLLDESFKTISTLSPLLFESINLPAMVCHCMKIIKRLVDFLSPGQVSAIAGGQLVYALGEKFIPSQIYPSHYNDIVLMMGPLYIDLAFLSAIEG